MHASLRRKPCGRYRAHRFFRICKTKRADGSEAERSFSIVGSNEANPRQGKISDESAVGKALVGAKVGQTVEVETPAGIVEYTIISVS